MSPDLFAAFGSQSDELLRLISCNIDDVMLQEIAAADYGQDIKKHFEQLRKIRDEGFIAVPMEWHPEEVLELIRWSEPEDPEHKPGATGVRGHWMRAFACVALLRAAAEPENRNARAGWNQTLIQLIESLPIIGEEFFQPSGSFLAWLINRLEANEEAEELAFGGLGLLWLSLHMNPSISDATIASLSAWVIAQERKDAETAEVGDHSWLLGTTWFNQLHSKWRRLGKNLSQMNLEGRPQPLRDDFELIGHLLASDEY